MSLRRLRSALLAADLKPHSLAVGATLYELSALASSSSRQVFRKAWRHGDHATIAELLSGDPWPRDAIDAYKALPQDERMEALALAGFTVHEMVHKIDFFTTPFGVAFHGRSCLETLGLQQFAPQIIASVERSGEHSPLRDAPGRRNDHLVSEGMDALLARIRWFDVIRGAPPRYVTSGWAGSKDIPLHLLNQRFYPVTVHNLMTTLALPEQPAGYLRPLTILESRAVAISLLHLFGRLGADDYACAEVAAYLNTFYEPRAEYPDYRFLLDLFASTSGTHDFAHVVSTGGPATLEALLRLVIVVGWYALHAPPIMPDEDDAFSNSNTITRLIAALRCLEDEVREKVTGRAGTEFLDLVERSTLAQSLRLRPCEDVLNYCLGYITFVKDRNRNENTHPGLAAHFDYIFDVQLAQFERRLGRGYESMLGMPDRGHLLGGFEDLRTDEHFLLEAYPAPIEVQQWFTVRENLVFGYARPPGFSIQLRSFIDSRPYASAAFAPAEPAEDARRSLALGAAAFREGDYDKSEPLLEHAAALGWPAAAYMLGVIRQGRGDDRGAESAFRQADAGGLAEASYNLGIMLRERGDTHQAESALRRADARGDPDGACDLGFLLLDKGADWEALAAFCRGDARGHPEAANSVGVLLTWLRRFLLAREAFERADARGSANGSYNLSRVYDASGRDESAAAALVRATKRGFLTSGVVPADGEHSYDSHVTRLNVEREEQDAAHALAHAHETFEAMASHLAAKFAEVSRCDVIEPLCMGILSGMNVVIAVATESFDRAAGLAESATTTVADATTMILTPAIASSRRATGLVPREADFVILRDITRFSDELLRSLMPILDDSAIGGRYFMFQGRKVLLPALIAVIAVLDVGDSTRSDLGDLAPLFPIGILLP
jgi:tetratricopeptide (TPR) repeat protein